MRFAVLATILALVVSLPRRGDTCSPAFDWGEAPASEQDFDPDRAPAPPQVRLAETRTYGIGGGCGNTDCGYTALWIELDEMPEVARLRVTYPDGEVEWGEPRADGSGGAELRLIWQSWYETPTEISIAVVDDAGYGSMDVAVDVVDGGDF